MEGSLSARALDDVQNGTTKQNFAKVAKILRLSQKYSKTNPV